MALTFESPAQRGAWIAAQRDAKRTFPQIGADLGITGGRVQQLYALHARRTRRAERTPNTGSLSVRALNVLRPVTAPRDREDETQADALAPGRVAALTPRQFIALPNAGFRTLNEVTAWLESHGLVWARGDGDALPSSDGEALRVSWGDVEGELIRLASSPKSAAHVAVLIGDLHARVPGKSPAEVLRMILAAGAAVARR